MRKCSRTFVTAAFVLVSALSLSACGEETTEPSDSAKAPVTPPPASMHLDLSFFADGGAATADESEGPVESAALARFNWTNAVVRVLIVNAFVDAAFSPPFAVFELALQAEPKSLGDGHYVWTYRHVENGQETRIDLTGRAAAGSVSWELRVTDPTHRPPFDNALWFRGVSRDDGRQGYWVFEDPTRGGAEYARIDWLSTSDGDFELTIENLDDADEGRGDVVTYELDGRITSLSFEDVSDDATMSVQWDVVTGVGSLIAPDYNDGQRACWDETQQDVECVNAVTAL